MISIRQAQPTDAKDIQTLLRKTWLDTYGAHLSQATLDAVYKNWQSIELLTSQIENPDFYFPVAVLDEQIVGLATARSIDGVTTLFRLYVSPQFQRQGIGRQLLEAVTAHFPENKKLQLHVEALNKKGQAFYLKEGFKEVSRGEEKVGEGVIEQILMERVEG